MRLKVINTLNKVIFEHQSLNTALEKNAAPIEKEICYGTLRHYFYLDFSLSKLLKKPLNEKDFDIFILLLIGIYELEFMDTPDFAVVNECVNVTKKLKKEWSKNLVNAILRNYLRENAKIKNKLDDDAKYLHPKWLIKKLKNHYPNNWKNIIIEANKRPPMSCRINVHKISRKDYLSKFSVDADISSEIPSAIILKKPVNVSDLPGFSDGLISVQDIAAQFTPGFLELKPGLRILDACAAPGGKTCHILESEKDIDVIALDIDEQRLQKIQENLSRLDLNATLLCADASKPEDWWDQQPFNRILLDAPCSATGVIRRHPDIKLLRQATDIEQLAKQQLNLLEKLWPLLKPDGILVYATCSILPEENNLVIKRFLEKTPNATLKSERQILTGENNMDGFYYAVLTKK